MKTRWITAAGLALLALAAGAQQGASDAPPASGEAAARAQALKDARVSPRQKAAFEKAELADRNAKDGASQLAANGARPGVTSLPSGVQYRILKTGNGTRPGNANAVLCRYKGTLADGSVFDASDDKAPALLKVAGLVPGLKEAVQLMPAGSKWEVVVPPQLGYGARGREGVGPNAVLTYVVDVVGIQ